MAENGLTCYKLGQKLESDSFIKFLGEEKYKKLVTFVLHYIADLDIPIKRFGCLCIRISASHELSLTEEPLWSSVTVWLTLVR
jgi:hypothetical protein